MYPEAIIENEIDYDNITKVLTEFNYDNCKVVLVGNDIVSKGDIINEVPISNSEEKEKYFNVRYRLY